MDIMPLRFITHEDASLVGKELTDLAAMKRLDFPVPDGIVLFPPHLPFTHVLRNYQEHGAMRFEQSLELIKKQILAIEIPDEATKELVKHHFDPKKIWRDALEQWLQQMRSKVWREGVSEQLIENLSPIPIFFLKNSEASGQAFYDPEEKLIRIQTIEGELEPKEQNEIKELVEQLKKKMLSHYVLHWVKDSNGIHIVRVVGFTHTIEEKKYEQEVTIKQYIGEPTIPIKTKLKIFADLSEGLSIEKDVDGIFLASERIETDDQKILKLVESGLVMDEYVIFQLSNQQTKDDVSSTLRLLHQPELVQKELRTFLFAKHNYSRTILHNNMPLRQALLHLQLGIPKIVSVGELKEMKVLMKKNGVERRGNTKIWVELSVPENWINLSAYLEEGIDGVIVDLDQLYGALIGVSDFEHHPFYNFSASMVLAFLERFIKELKVPILFKSAWILDDEVIKFAIQHGVFGVILNRIQLGGAREYIARFEKRHMLTREIKVTQIA